MVCGIQNDGYRWRDFPTLHHQRNDSLVVSIPFLANDCIARNYRIKRTDICVCSSRRDDLKPQGTILGESKATDKQRHALAHRSVFCSILDAVLGDESG